MNIFFINFNYINNTQWKCGDCRIKQISVQMRQNSLTAQIFIEQDVIGKMTGFKGTEGIDLVHYILQPNRQRLRYHSLKKTWIFIQQRLIRNDLLFDAEFHPNFAVCDWPTESIWPWTLCWFRSKEMSLFLRRRNPECNTLQVANREPGAKYNPCLSSSLLWFFRENNILIEIFNIYVIFF